MRNLLRAALLCLTLAAPVAEAAEALPPSPIAKTELVLDAAQITADGVVWAGVRFTLPEHWHIYWQNPGDSGIPTTFSWQLPEGLSADAIIWPTPERIETSGIINYGYSNSVTLPVPLTAARDGISGTVSVTAKWLVCKETCIPESATLSAAVPGSTPGAAAILAEAIDAAPRVVTDANAAYWVKGEEVFFGITGPTLMPSGAAPVTGVRFFPQQDGIATNNDPQTFKVNADATALTVAMKRGTAELPESWTGVLVLEREGKPQAFQVTAAHQAVVQPAADAPPAPQATTTLLAALGLAFLGGLLLNIMPCVLPILALKALALAKKAEASRAAAARQGVAYTAGVVASFLLIAGGMLALKASGAAIGWGFQLQHSGFVAVLLVVMLLVSANLLGLFELPVLFGTRASTLDENKLAGSFFTGVLAVLVATPCTAPFMATAIGATLTFPAPQALAVFAALGAGMAAPFLLISLLPGARRLLPKPGKWMLRFKQFLALPMLTTAAWLVWVLVQLSSTSTAQVDAHHVPYSATELARLRDAGTPVLVDATAAWCLTCKVNERVALKPEAMQQFFREKQVTLMVADWTASDPAITEYLAGFGRNGVPLYVYYPPHAAPVVLPQILTPALVREAIDPPQGYPRS